MSGLSYTQTTITTNKAWRATARTTGSKRGGQLAKGNLAPVGNGSSHYGEVMAGTILAEDENGLLHPLGMANITADVSASSTIAIDVTAGFRVGDTVAVRAGSDRPSVLDINGQALTVTPRVEGLSLVVEVAGNNTSAKLSYDPFGKKLTFQAATNGTGVATSTHADLASELLRFSGLIKAASATQPSTLVAALPESSLGTPKYGLIADALTVGVTAANSLTLSAPVSAKAGDYLIKPGASKAVGILDITVSTVAMIGTTLVASNQVVDVAYEGDARNSSTFLPNLPGGPIGEVVRRMLGGHVTVDPADGVTEVVPHKLVGFRFLDV